MADTTTVLQIECYKCNLWQNPETREWRVATVEERRAYAKTGARVSHGLCLPCYGSQLRESGHFSEGEVEKLLKEARDGEKDGR